MPKSKSDFTNFIDARPNYFPGQFLLEDDFEIEQKYFIDRQKYHRQSLHVSGIIEGLEVEVIKDKQEVLIKSGSGINSNGDLIVLKKDTSFSQFTTLTVGELYISYREEKQVKQQEDFTRWQEVPTIGFAATTPNDGVKLAKISIVNNVLSLDLTVRSYSGIFLPNATGNDLTLRSGGNANPNVAILNGSLTVTGTITGNINATNINSGILTVDRIPNLSADKITSGILAVERIPNLPADKITSGVLAVDRIPNLPADKITSGTIQGGLTINTSNTEQGSLVINTGGTGNWNKFVVNTTSNWGDGNNQHVTIGAGGGSGIMLQNPHVSWQSGEKRASIRYGRSGGVASGSYWDVGVRESGAFSFALNGHTDHKMTIDSSGNLNVNGTGTSSFAGNLRVTGTAAINNVFLGDVGHGSVWAGFSHTSQVSQSSYALLQNSAGTYTLINKKAGDGYIGFRVDNNDRMVINNNGNVGIGTITPSEKLEVSGNLKVTGVLIGTAKAPGQDIEGTGGAIREMWGTANIAFDWAGDRIDVYVDLGSGYQKKFKINTAP